MKKDTKIMLPTLEEIRQGIEHLKSVNWSPYKSGDDIHKYEEFMHHEIVRHIKILPQGVLTLNGLVRIPGFFRARPLDDIKTHELRAEYSYPPISNATIKRANLPGYPVFYCAQDALTAVMEVIQNYKTFEGSKDKLYCISSWRIKDSRNLKLANFIGQLNEENPFYKFSQFQQNEIKKQFEEFVEDIEQAQIASEIYTFLSDAFLDDKEYGISAYLSHTYLYSGQRRPVRADILMYPSVITHKRSINYAINPNFVDERMYLKCVYTVKVENISYVSGKIDSIDMSPVKVGIIRETTMDWKRFDMNDEEIKNLIESDFPSVEITKKENL